MFAAFDRGHLDTAENFKKRAEDMIGKILSLGEISPAGREEWFALRNLVAGYDLLDAESRQIVLSFATPFSQKYMQQFS